MRVPLRAAPPASANPSELKPLAKLGPLGVNVQLNMSWTAVTPPEAPVNPMYAVGPPTVLGISIGQELLNTLTGHRVGYASCSSVVPS